jgi:hypothetical protein
MAVETPAFTYEYTDCGLYIETVQVSVLTFCTFVFRKMFDLLLQPAIRILGGTMRNCHSGFGRVKENVQKVRTDTCGCMGLHHGSTESLPTVS